MRDKFDFIPLLCYNKRKKEEFVMEVLNHGKRVPFNKDKIKNAIIQAANQISMPDFSLINSVVFEIESSLRVMYKNSLVRVEEIENEVMSVLYKRMPDVAREYSSYKIKREQSLKNPSETDKVLNTSKEIDHENANKKATLTHIKNAYLAEIPSKEKFFKEFPAACIEAHNRGVVYAHDSGYSIRQMTNCELLNLDALFSRKGFVLNGTWIGKIKSFHSCCTITTQILTHVTGNTYGGCTINLLALAKFVRVSREKHRAKVREEWTKQKFSFTDEQVNSAAEQRLQEEIKDGIQTFYFQNQTLCSNVGQAVFLTVSVWLNEDPEYTDDLILIFKELLRQRIEGIPNEQGVRENPNFPKILYFLDKDTMRGGKYYDITKLCARCSARRLVPDYMSYKKHMELKGIPTPSMGCRALLSPYKDENGNLITWGRFNCGVMSLNLPYIAMENNPSRNEEQLFANLKHYLSIANQGIIWRVNHVAKITSDCCPILWQYGGLATLKPGETLESLVYGGYATVTLGYSGLFEAVKYITGENHWEGKGKELAYKILDYLNDNNKELGENLNVSVALYGTPAETLTDKFAKACIRDFGTIDGESIRNFETNSYHIPVFQEIDAFSKLKIESEFSDKTLGGSISYVEVPNLSNNEEAMLELIEFIGDNCLYAEINSEISNCSCCGFHGYDFEKIKAPDNTVRWKCPCCGETDPEKVKTSYRICGYISNYTPNEGRSEDIMNRVKHLG